MMLMHGCVEVKILEGEEDIIFLARNLNCFSAEKPHGIGIKLQ
jgi:hypothetical protein